MKTRIIKNLLLLPLPIASLGLMLAGQVTAQTFTTLYSSTHASGGGAQISVISQNILYGTEWEGGSSENGTVFSVHTDGTGFTTLHSFTALTGYCTDFSACWTNGFPTPTNSDGAGPGGLVLSGNTLYGAALSGGNDGEGTVFAVNIDGTGFTNLHSFTATSELYGNGTNIDGVFPSGLIVSGNSLYGTAGQGGSEGGGTVFAINTDGTGFSILHSFTDPNINNSDGAQPQGGLILSGSTLYGTTTVGGRSYDGTVFSVKTDGTAFATLHSFTANSRGSLPTNSDGAYPSARLILSGNTLFGTTPYGGSSGNGTVFAVKTDGTGFTTLHTFTGHDYLPNNDGAGASGGLVLSRDTLYGTADNGGSAGRGTVFSVNSDGTGFKTLHSFTTTVGPFYTNSDGAFPGVLILSGNTIYGSTSQGGGYNYGTVFSISLPPQLAITPSSGNLILTWPTNFSGFTLQSTTNLSSPVWTTNLAAPVVVNGQNTVTNPISGRQEFFRLSQ